jgi:hypothetical protein
MGIEKLMLELTPKQITQVAEFLGDTEYKRIKTEIWMVGDRETKEQIISLIIVKC